MATTTSSATDVRAKVRDTVGQFGPPQLAAIAILGIVALIAGMWFLSWATSPTWNTVVAGKTPAETADIVAALDAEGIANRLAAGGTGVQVSAADADRAQVVLGAEGLVNPATEGWEIMDSQGFTTSSFRQRIDLQRAMEGELARSIVALDGVESAEVNLAIPEERLFSEEQDLTTASVVVGGAIGDDVASSIAKLVASSVPGLDVANVSVIGTGGEVFTGAGAGPGGQGQLKARQVMEAQLEMDAQSMLAAAFGPGRAVVRVSADLNFDESQVETTSYDPETQVALSEQTSQEGFSGGANQVPLGTIGTVDDVTDAGEIAGDGEGSGYVKLESSSQFGVPTTVTRTNQTPGQVERLTIAVLIDSTLEPAPQAQQIQDLVAAAVGLDQERGDTIVVQSLEFDSPAEGEDATVTAAAAAGGGMVAKIIGYATTGVAVVGIILVLLFLRKGLKNLGGGRRQDVTDEARALGSGGAGHGEALDLPAIERSQGDQTVNDLLRVIDNQNDEVADLLRGWLAETKA